MKIKTALKAAALAATLVFSTASHAAVGIGYTSSDEGVVYDPGATMLHGIEGWQPVNTYDLTGTTLADHILAFCIQPLTEQAIGTTYTQHTAVTSLSSMFADGIVAHRGDRVQALFEQNYGNLTTSSATSAARLGFALALWDLVADDANLSTGAQAFTGGAWAVDTHTFDPIALDTAQDMLNATAGAGLTNMYKYTVFTGRSPGSLTDDSQSLMSVTAAVPEADTWAMLVAGLGLVGFMGRRKSDKSEKFAA